MKYLNEIIVHCNEITRTRYLEKAAVYRATDEIDRAERAEKNAANIREAVENGGGHTAILSYDNDFLSAPYRVRVFPVDCDDFIDTDLGFSDKFKGRDILRAAGFQI